MGFPESVLTSDEQVVRHLHPHWKALIRPALVVLVGIAAVVAAWLFLPGLGVVIVAVLVLALVLWLAVWPWVTWLNTNYVLTNERILLREGVFSRHGRDIPLGRVNDVSFSHNLIERMLGCGTLTIESAGERGQVTLKDIPHVEQVQTALYDLVEQDRDRHTFGDEDRAAIVRDVTTARDGEPKG